MKRLVLAALACWAWLFCMTMVARASSYQDQAAQALCATLEQNYGAAVNGTKVTFRECLPAAYDKVAKQWDYWVFFKTVHHKRVELAVVEVDGQANWLTAPVPLSAYEYAHGIRPSSALAA